MKINLYILFFLFILSCKTKNNSIIIIDVKSSGMGFQPDKKMLTLKSSARLVFKNEIELYIQPELHLNFDYIKNESGEIIDEKVKSIDTLHKIFARSESYIKGIEYDLESIDDTPPKTFDADSLWKTLYFHRENIGDNGIGIGKPIKVINKGNIKIEHYVLRQTGGIDSVYRYYDISMKDIPYSFSEKLDSAKKNKLFKVFAISNEIPKGLYLPDMAVPRREYFYEMKVVTENINLKSYEDIIDKFNKDLKKLNLK